MIVSNPSPPDPVAVRLGYLALLPFVFGALCIWFGPAVWSARGTMALSAYAAVVVSFIGGIYWGLGFRQVQPDWGTFVWGVIP